MVGNPKSMTKGRYTLEGLAYAANVPLWFAQEAEREGLIAPEAGGGYRSRLKSWLTKLYVLRSVGMTWDEIHDWTQRRWRKGHEHERRWPEGYGPEKT